MLATVMSGRPGAEDFTLAKQDDIAPQLQCIVTIGREDAIEQYACLFVVCAVHVTSTSLLWKSVQDNQEAATFSKCMYRKEEESILLKVLILGYAALEISI